MKKIDKRKHKYESNTIGVSKGLLARTHVIKFACDAVDEVLDAAHVELDRLEILRLGDLLIIDRLKSGLDLLRAIRLAPNFCEREKWPEPRARSRSWPGP